MSPVKNGGSNLIKQGSILALSGIIVRIIGLLYRVPMNRIIGDEAVGIYGIAFKVYNIVLILSSYSMPLAVSKMVSARCVKKEYVNSYKVLKGAMLFAVIMGGMAALILFFGATFIEKNFLGRFSGVAISLRIFAPTIFIMAVIGALRGYYQGRNTMIPTSVSQIIEQVINAIASVAGAYILMNIYTNSKNRDGWGAAGGTLGTALGAFAALLFLVFVYFLNRPLIKKQVNHDTTLVEESYREIFKVLIMTMVPVILSQTVYNISGVIDESIFQSIMGQKGFSDKEIKVASGLNSGYYMLFLTVPIAVATSMSSSMVPSIVVSLTKGIYEEVKEKVQRVVKFNMIIAFPAAIGLTVLGEKIIQIIFPETNYVIIGNLFRIGSVAVIFYALSTVTSGVLQSINLMRLPVIHSTVSLIVHIVIVFLLLWFTDLGIYALVIGNVTYPIIVCVLNWRAVAKHLNYKQEIRTTFALPLVCSLGMGTVTFLIYHGLYLLIHSISISTILSIAVSAVVYFVLLLLTKDVTEKELYSFPFGRTLASIGIRLHLI